VLLSALLVGPFAQMGLALATSLAALLNGGLLWIGLLRRKRYRLQPGWKLFSFQLFLACTAMSFVIIYFNPNLEDWFKFDILTRVLTLSTLILGSAVAYVGTLLVTGLRIRHVLVRVV
jgi:putative peptidoglycan lipid II flippase